MRLPAANALFGVFSEYPLTRHFNDSRIPITITLCSFLTLIGLVTFNVLTQGYYTSSESVLRGNWYPKNSTLTCQPATMEMGNSYFTQEYNGHLGGNGKPGGNLRGSFRWSLQSVLRGPEGQDMGETGFYYEGSPLKCNITSISLTFNFQIQSFSYAMGAMCVTPSLEKNTPDNYISLETSFSILDKAFPKFTEEVQNILQAQIFGLSKFYPQLNFSANALPGSAFPPYTNANNTLAENEVPNRDIMQWSVWLYGFNYTLTDNYQDFNHSHLYMNPEPQGLLFLSPQNAQPTSFDQATMDLLNANKSGLQIAAVGIGGIRPIPPNATLENSQRLPAPMPLYLNLTESILAIMMDMAGKDLNKRALATGYLCTITSTPWKNAFTMIAMLIGSCAGMFGAALTVMLFIARRFDSHMISKREAVSRVQSATTQSPLIGLEYDEANLESQMKETRRETDKTYGSP